MGRSLKDKVQVVVSSGEISLEATRLTAYFKPRRWLLKINPVFIAPGFRKDHRKLIYVHGKKWGYAEWRGGCIPLPQFSSKARGVRRLWFNFVRRTFGICCSAFDRGYYFISLRTRQYVVTRGFVEDGSVFCRIYFYPEGEAVAAFTIDKDFKKVYKSIGPYDIRNTVHVIVAYVIDSLLFANIIGKSDRSIEIV